MSWNICTVFKSMGKIVLWILKNPVLQLYVRFTTLAIIKIVFKTFKKQFIFLLFTTINA